MGSKAPSSTVLEAMLVTFRKHTPLALDDCLYALQDMIPRLEPFFFAPLFAASH